MASRSILPAIRQAISGDAASQCKLGRVYLDGGEGLAANEATAYLWLSRAAAQGCAEAWQLIGARIAPETAGADPQIVRWYELAAADGCVPAQARLGRLLLERARLDPASAACGRAIALLRSAALQGDADARCDLGAFLIVNRREGDCAEARALLEQAYHQGRRTAARLLADYYWDHRDLDSALAWYRRCADLADPEICFRMGSLHHMLGLPAADLLERAANAGHMAACEELGIAYAIGAMVGAGVRRPNRRLKKARYWLERADSLGSAKASFLIATLYRHPTSSICNLHKARGWQWKAARLGHPEAALRTGLAMLREVAVGRSPARQGMVEEASDVVAARFLTVAAKAGYAEARQALQGLAAQPPECARITDEDWLKTIDVARRKDPNLALRLKLGRSLGLSTKELLLVDPRTADRGDWFVVDFRSMKLHRRRRIVSVERPDQRNAIDEAKEGLAIEAETTVDWRTAYRARYGCLRRLCRQAGIGAALFPRAGAAEHQSGARILAVNHLVAVPSKLRCSD